MILREELRLCAAQVTHWLRDVAVFIPRLLHTLFIGLSQSRVKARLISREL
jgi:hypothetical protein